MPWAPDGVRTRTTTGDRSVNRLLRVMEAANHLGDNQLLIV